MVEFSERELTIMYVMDSLIQPALKDVPLDIRKNVCIGLLSMRGITFKEPEIIDLIEAVNQERKLAQAQAVGLLGKHGHLLGNL